MTVLNLDLPISSNYFIVVKLPELDVVVLLDKGVETIFYLVLRSSRKVLTNFRPLTANFTE